MSRHGRPIALIAFVLIVLCTRSTQTEARTGETRLLEAKKVDKGKGSGSKKTETAKVEGQFADDDIDVDEKNLAIEQAASQVEHNTGELSSPKDRDEAVAKEMSIEGDLNSTPEIGAPNPSAHHFPTSQVFIVALFVIGSVGVVLAFKYCKRLRPSKH